MKRAQTIFCAFACVVLIFMMCGCAISGEGVTHEKLENLELNYARVVNRCVILYYVGSNESIAFDAARVSVKVRSGQDGTFADMSVLHDEKTSWPGVVSYWSGDSATVYVATPAEKEKWDLQLNTAKAFTNIPVAKRGVELVP